MHGQTSVETGLVLVRRGGDGPEISLKYKKWQFSYLDSERRTTGWVMHEYVITDPLLPVPGAVISRVRMDAKAKKKLQQPAPAADNNGGFMGEAAGCKSALVNTGEGGCAACALLNAGEMVAMSTAAKSPSMRTPTMTEGKTGDYFLAEDGVSNAD